VVGRGDQRGHVGLAGATRHRRGGGIHRVHPGVGRGEQGGELAAGRVVGVQVDRHVEALPQGGDEGAGGGGAQQPGHILDR
jgi:hypothetical protein